MREGMGKFRGMAIDGSGRKFGFLVLGRENDDAFILAEDEGIADIPTYCRVGWEEVDQDTVGQYTGLKDKNGKEIFEGDMLGCDEFIDVVKWEHASWRIDPCDDFLNESHRDSEVVGNIHEGEWIICDEVGYRNIHDKGGHQ